ncbi:carbohydrate ABC transporter permease [Paenibacillus sacheonensis]|nr:carbohydrate ABC transporter permease [Paenibacillus sacheonensis]MBM7564095.1 N-acetylglucosamine transport system permease protein [Paenibacillus sacheonensis]
MRPFAVNRIPRWISGAVLVLWAFCVVYPVFWSIMGSLKDNQQFFNGKAWALPKFPLLWSNFSYTWETYHFGRYFVNSIVVTVGSMALALLLSATTGYVLARYTFKGSGLLYYFYISSLMIPAILTLVPMFFLFDTLHLTNSLTGLILLYAIGALPFGIFVIMGFFKSLPRELSESATMDGASHYGVFLRIMLPLAMPGLITVSIVNALSFWNEYPLALILMNDPGRYTLPVGLAVMQGEMQYRTEWGPLFAGLFISMVPILLLYAIFQSRINEGLVAGAVK